MSIQVDKDEPCRCAWNLACLQKIGFGVADESDVVIIVVLNQCMQKPMQIVKMLLVEGILTFCGLSVIQC